MRWIMGSPNDEFAIIVNRVNEIVNSIVGKVKDEIVSGRANGTPDAQILRGIRAQETIPTARLTGLKKALTNDVSGRIRQVYSTTQSELSTALVHNRKLDDILKPENGYKIPKNKADPLQAAIDRAEGKAKIFDDIRQRDTVARSGQVRMIWIAAFVNTCPDCLQLASKVMTFDQWKQSPFWPGNGNTVCGEKCQCHLAPVEAIANRFRLLEPGADGKIPTQAKVEKNLEDMMENGVKLQKKKIAELEKIRGQKYADSTRLQMLGEVRTRFFNERFQKRESLFLKKVPKTKDRVFETKVKDKTFRIKK
jgi:hypothetical protein